MCLNGVYSLGKNTLHTRQYKVTLDFALMVEILDAAVIIVFCSKTYWGHCSFIGFLHPFFLIHAFCLKKIKVVGFDSFLLMT